MRRWILSLPSLFVVFLSVGMVGCQNDAGGTSSTVGSTPAIPSKSAAPPETTTKPTVVGDRLGDTGGSPVVLSKQTESSPFRFKEIAKESGIDFVHFSGMTAEKHFPTANGSGVAFFDFDNDGKLDIYFATATLLPPGTAKKGPNRLYKNLGDGKFKDVTESAGVGFTGFCHGIVVGDIDNDGDQDLFLCNYGPNVLYLNNGDGTFKDVSKAAGIDAPGWSSSGAFLDYDNDGDLDLYVSNYGKWKLPEDDKFCGDPLSTCASTALRARSRPSSTSSIGTTATGRSPTSTTRSSSRSTPRRKK